MITASVSFETFSDESLAFGETEHRGFLDQPSMPSFCPVEIDDYLKDREAYQVDEKLTLRELIELVNRLDGLYLDEQSDDLIIDGQMRDPQMLHEHAPAAFNDRYFNLQHRFRIQAKAGREIDRPRIKRALIENCNLLTA